MRAFGRGLVRSFVGSVACATAGLAQSASLELRTSGGATCFADAGGSPVVIEILMTPGPGAEIVGGQFFLAYDTARLQLAGYGTPQSTPTLVRPGDAPFTQQVHESVNPAAGEVDYAVGLPHPPPAGATTPTVMARLEFTAQAQVCDASGLVWFRPAPPPFQTRLAAKVGSLGDVPVVPDPLTNLHAISIDGTAPTLNGVPADATVECDAVPPPATPTATDNCDETPTIHFQESSTQTSDGTCTDQNYTITRTWTATDDCGNTSPVATQVITVQDTTAPTLSGVPADATVECDTVPPPALPTATDNCDATPTIQFQEVSTQTGNGTCTDQNYTITRTWTASDNCGNTSPVATQVITVQDTVGPAVTCPAAVARHADAGSCSATITWTAATALDGCAGDVSASVVYEIDLGDNGSIDATQPGTTYAFPSGVHRVTARATDPCANTGSCSFLVSVSGFNELVAQIELSPTLIADPSAAPGDALTRCVEFTLVACGGTAVATSAEVAFSLDHGPGRGRGSITLLVPCGAYTCITAQDPLHTLVRRIDSTPDFAVAGTQYVADFTGDPATGGRWLVQGDLFDDPGQDLIDILDFGVYITEFPGPYDSGDPGADPDGNTDCATPYPHADLDGDGIVFGSDFTFITNNFLTIGDPDCCGAPGQAQPITDIGLADLRAMGLGRLVVADLNRDGRLNRLDIEAFLSGARPRPGIGGPSTVPGGAEPLDDRATPSDARPLRPRPPEP